MLDPGSSFCCSFSRSHRGCYRLFRWFLLLWLLITNGKYNLVLLRKFSIIICVRRDTFFKCLEPLECLGIFGFPFSNFIFKLGYSIPNTLPTCCGTFPIPNSPSFPSPGSELILVHGNIWIVSDLGLLWFCGFPAIA